MKKLFFCFVTASLLIACNNDKTADKGSVAVNAAHTAEDKSDKSPAGCASFLWFKKGTVLQYEVKGQANYTSRTTTTINDVHQDGPALVAEYTTELDNGKKVNSSYRCEGSKLYVDMKSLFNDMVSTQNSGLEMEIDDSYIIFPWDMKEGDELDQSVFQLTAKRNGKEFMKMKKVINDRHVGAMEKITTAAGTFDCLKITEKWTMSTTMMGKEVTRTDEKTIQWFAPQAGLVKTETYDKNDKLQLTTELTSLK